MESMDDAVKRLEGVLIVSCQASSGEPLCKPEHIVAMSLSAIAGGAKALRLEGLDNVSAVRHDPGLPAECPLIGLVKDDGVPVDDRPSVPYITNRYEQAEGLARAGCDIIALDATGRPRADGLGLDVVFKRIHTDLHKSVWADVSTFAEGIKAIEYGADVVSTTLYGYTKETAVTGDHGPGFELLKELIDHSPIPVVLEGRVWHPDEVARAFDMGAYAVVVGSAITRPQLITQRFARSIPSKRARRPTVG
ncbi:MAG TPA: N-acetylmannosamine-6-phosphate 2-epimerase [Trichormus sp.]